MFSSSCPKCKKHLSPDVDICPSCGFNRKKYFESNYYSPNHEKKSSKKNPKRNTSRGWKILYVPFYSKWSLFTGSGDSRKDSNLNSRGHGFLKFYVLFAVTFFILILFVALIIFLFGK